MASDGGIYAQIAGPAREHDVTLLILAVLALDVVAVLLVLAESEGFYTLTRFEIADPSKRAGSW